MTPTRPYGVLSVAKIITPHDADGERPTTDVNSILAYSGLVGDRPSHFSSLFRILGDKTKNILVEHDVPDTDFLVHFIFLIENCSGIGFRLFV